MYHVNFNVLFNVIMKGDQLSSWIPDRVIGEGDTQRFHEFIAFLGAQLWTVQCRDEILRHIRFASSLKIRKLS